MKQRADSATVAVQALTAALAIEPTGTDASASLQQALDAAEAVRVAIAGAELEAAFNANAAYNATKERAQAAAAAVKALQAAVDLEPEDPRPWSPYS